MRGTRLPLAAIGLCVVAVWVLPAAAEPPQDALIQAHIAAGEFAPAIALAQQAADPQQRDAWLAEIATAQARAGNRDASLRSAAEIGDDRVGRRRFPPLRPSPWADKAAATNQISIAHGA